MNYLFVSGVPRSGTTVLTKLLSSHEEIALGMERYKFLYSKNLIGKSHFHYNKFSDFKESETNVKYKQYYRTILPKYQRCSIVGDKNPNLFKHIPYLEKAFGKDTKFIFIARDIYEVCQSWDKRAQNPDDRWPIENDYKEAITLWNSALKKINRFTKDQKNILILFYDELFGEEEIGHQTVKEITDFLQVPLSKEFSEAYNKLSEQYRTEIMNKERNYNKEKQDYIEKNADIALYDNLRVLIKKKDTPKSNKARFADFLKSVFKRR